LDSITGTFFTFFFNSSFLLADFPFWGISGAAIFVIILLLGSALVSGSEVAFFSLSPNDIDDLKQENSKTSNRIIKLKEMPRTLLATILISNNFNMKLAIVGATGMVGNEILKIIQEKNLAYSELILVASNKSKGKELIINNKSHFIIERSN